MSAKHDPPLVAICGRPNVGKSTLFNRIVGRRKAIVHAEEGITRDRAYEEANWDDVPFRVVDTGGIVENPVDPVSRKIQHQVRLAFDEAKLILFVVDGQQEITRIDEEIRDELFKYGKPVILAVNKLDNPTLEANRTDFFVLGLGEPYAISATHGTGVAELLDAVIARLPDPAPGRVKDAEPDVIKVAILGKPNVGKSSFVNAILNEERNIVDERPGTTRDSIDIAFRWRDKHYLLIDTAGLRKKGNIKREVERFGVSRALRAVRRADVCLVMMDATEGLTEQDKRILRYVVDAGTAVVIVWTKWDLVEDKHAYRKTLADQFDLKAPFLKYIPAVTISNVTRQRLYTTFEYVDRIAAEAQKRVGTGELNTLMDAIRAKPAPATHKGAQAKILYATQVDVKPTKFVLFVNQRRLFHFSYVRFIENRIRDRYGFEGVPITIELREEKPKKRSGKKPKGKPRRKTK